MNFYDLIKEEFRKQSRNTPTEQHLLFGDTKIYFKARKHFHGVGPTGNRFSLIEGKVYHGTKKPDEKLINDGIIEIIPSTYNATYQRLTGLFNKLPSDLPLMSELQLVRLGISMIVEAYHRGDLQKLLDGEERLNQVIQKINDRFTEDRIVKSTETKKPFLTRLMGA